jgi:hypothetical protein
MKNVYFIYIVIICITSSATISFAQFPGAAGTVGSTAIHKDSSIFINWASNCKVQRGYIDIAQPHLGTVIVGEPEFAIGKAGENGVVSLGDGGSAILEFHIPITNGEGADFAVFENAFNDNFLELAFVEVSSDGIHYVRFPAVSNTSTVTQIGPFDNLGDATLIHNLAGKYRVAYGTPFDLEELKDATFLDINAVTHIKIIDVVGSVNPSFGSVDANNNLINDPYPTAFASGGFDLDAVGVIHQLWGNNLPNLELEHFVEIYPNPTHDIININLEENRISEIRLFDSNGLLKMIFNNNKANIEHLTSGVYIISIKLMNGRMISRSLFKK